jgi:hypothetical protein
MVSVIPADLDAHLKRTTNNHDGHEETTIMKTYHNGSERSRTPAAIGLWVNERGAHDGDSTAHQYGRRIEADRSWTVYHVFTGVLAHVGGDAMTGLSHSDATSAMSSLNRRSERIALPSIAGKISGTAECRS